MAIPDLPRIACKRRVFRVYLDKAVTLAKSVEMTWQEAKYLWTFATSKPTTTPDADLFDQDQPWAIHQESWKQKCIKLVKTCWWKTLRLIQIQILAIMHSCGKQGQITKMCWSKLNSKKAQTVSSKQVHNVTDALSFRHSVPTVWCSHIKQQHIKSHFTSRGNLPCKLTQGKTIRRWPYLFSSCQRRWQHAHSWVETGYRN